MTPSFHAEDRPHPRTETDCLQTAHQLATGLRDGAVLVTVHGSKIVRVERTE